MLKVYKATRQTLLSSVVLSVLSHDLSYAEGTLAAGSGADREVVIGQVLGKVLFGTPTEDHTDNTGNGAMSGLALKANAQLGDYTVECITATTDAATFAVFDPLGRRMADAATDAAYDNGEIAFTIADGATDFIVGDAFTITVPEGNYNAWGTNKATRLLQSTDDTDFQFEVAFLDEPSLRYQMRGIMVEQDAGNWIRFELHHDGNGLFVYGSTTTDGSPSARFKTAVAPGEADIMRVTRVGDVWTFEYSADGETWTTAGSFTHAITVTGVGPYAASVGPGYTAEVDYAISASDPLTSEDDLNAAPIAADDTVATTAGTPVLIAKRPSSRPAFGARSCRSRCSRTDGDCVPASDSGTTRLGPSLRAGSRPPSSSVTSESPPSPKVRMATASTMVR